MLTLNNIQCYQHWEACSPAVLDDTKEDNEACCTSTTQQPFSAPQTTTLRWRLGTMEELLRVRKWRMELMRLISSKKVEDGADAPNFKMLLILRLLLLLLLLQLLLLLLLLPLLLLLLVLLLLLLLRRAPWPSG
ncbi:hypothetical protein ACOMHN_025039 [Nucella lapillus]